MTFKQSFEKNDIKQSPTKTWQGLTALQNGQGMPGKFSDRNAKWMEQLTLVGDGGKYMTLPSNSRK